MNEVTTRWTAALLGASGIAAAAFGAHGLERLTDARGLRHWAIAAALQLVTAPVILWCSTGIDQGRVRPQAPLLLALGVAVFCGTLYAMALGAPRFLGAITPLGGLALIGGWLVVAFRARPS